MSFRTALATSLILCVIAAPVASSSRLRSDFDDSGVVDFTDFLVFADTFNRSAAHPAFDLRADFDNSGTIDFSDFLIFAEDFGNTAPDVGNDIGNGLEIIHGPDGPEGGDRDNPFRSLTVHPLDANTVLMGTERNGFVKSIDGGQTWTRHRLGLRHHSAGYPEIWDVAYDPGDPTIVYAATLDSPGPVTGTFPSAIGGVYKSVDGGETWTRKNRGLTSSRITGVEVLPGDSSVVIIGVEGGTASFSALAGEFFAGGLYHSANGGEDWERAVTAVDDSTNGYLHILARDDVLLTFGKNLDEPDRNGGFLGSRDAGSSWETFGPDQRSLLITEFDVSSDGLTIVGNARDSFVHQISEDGGESWRSTPINQANGPVAISPADPLSILFVANQRTIKLSTDGLVSSLSVITTDANIGEIVFAPSDPTIVYAVTDGLLVYRSKDAGASFTLVTNIRSDVLNP